MRGARGDQAVGQGVVEAERIADRYGALADHDRVGVSELQGLEGQGLPLVGLPSESRSKATSFIGSSTSTVTLS